MKIFLISLVLLLGLEVRAQEEVKWLTLAEAEKLNKENPKPYLFDVYTDWCGWCKHMDKTTYADPIVISFVNAHFYPVRINAESTDTLFFDGKVYAPVRNGNKFISSLAVEMLGGQMSYPTTVFKYDPAKINLVVPGYLEIVKMQGFLVYFIENAWQSVNVNDFLTDFEAVFGVGAKQQAEADYWLSFQELAEKQQDHKKKTLLFLEASWNNSSRMMQRVVFTDSLVAAEAKEHFNCVRLDARSQDTITFMTHVFHNAGPQNHDLHQLAIALSDKVLRVPGIYLFDEQGKLMESLFYYMDRKRGRFVLDYVGSNQYKEMSWEDYLKVRAKETF